MSHGLRVVVADDDAAMRRLVRGWLAHLGHEVTAVDSGWALVRACHADRPDLVVSDVQMPHLDGLTAAEVVRRGGPMPVVLMSGSWEPGQVGRAAALGAVRLGKPFLPLQLVAAVETAVTPAPPPAERARVLVVDPDADTADSLIQLLGLYGCDVRAVRDGEDAEATAAAFRPHLILTELDMPRLSGLAAVRRIRDREWGREVRIVAHTGWGRDGDRERAAAAGCDAHLLKPVAPDILRGLVADLGAPAEPDAFV